MNIEKGSNAYDALSSYLPIPILRQQRNYWALMLKYEARDEGSLHRLDLIFDPAQRVLVDEEPLDVYEKEKTIGCLGVDGRTGSKVAAFDPIAPQNRIRMRKKDATFLHVTDLPGVWTLKEDLAAAAAYIGMHEPLRETKYVAGVTYEAMGTLAIRLGFQPMWHTDIDPEYASTLGYFQRARETIGRMPHQPLCPAVVYMPTDAFINRFSAVQSANSAL